MPWSFIGFILILIFVWYYIRSFRHPKYFPPGPKLPLPLIGDAYLLGKDFSSGFSALVRKYGKTVGLWLGSNRAVLVTDFNTLQDILNLHETADRGGMFEIKQQEIVRGGLSHGEVPGVVFSNDKTWIESRRTSLHILRDFGYGKNTMKEMIDDEVNNLIRHIDDHWINTPLNISQFFQISILSSLWRIISGESLNINDAKLTKLCKLVEIGLVETGDPLFKLSQKSITLFKFLNKIGVYQNFEVMKAIVEYCKDAMESCKQQNIDGDNPLSFIEAMLHKIQNNTDATSPLHGEVGELNLISILVDFFFAGSDTTSASLNWAMMFMITHPDVQTKVREELIHAKLSDQDQTPYTDAVIHEITRRGNIGPTALFHQTNKSLKIQQFWIPSKTLIVPMIGEIMHDPEHFPNPMQFNPNRYLTKNEDGSLKFTPHPRVIPFGVGRRRCLGENLAKTSLYQFFTAIILKYEIISGQDEPILELPTCGIVKYPQPYKLKFVKLFSEKREWLQTKQPF